MIFFSYSLCDLLKCIFIDLPMCLHRYSTVINNFKQTLYSKWYLFFIFILYDGMLQIDIILESISRSRILIIFIRSLVIFVRKLLFIFV